MSYKCINYCYIILHNAENTMHAKFYACRRNGRWWCFGFGFFFPPWKVEYSFLISTLSFGSMIRLISFFKEMSKINGCKLFEVRWKKHS